MFCCPQAGLFLSEPVGRGVLSDIDGGEWHSPGTEFLPGSNTIVYSDPGAELGDTQHIVKISNRRFRDDEETPLYPGYPLPEFGWSEKRYAAYSFVMPNLASELNCSKRRRVRHASHRPVRGRR